MTRPAARLRSIITAEAGLLAAFMAFAITLLAGLKLGSEVLEGDTQALDGAILRWLRAATDGSGAFPTALRSAMLDLTALGDNLVLALVTLLAAGYLLAARKRRMALLLVAAIAAGMLVSFLLKDLFGRPRPDIVVHLVATRTASFPSGHAMNSAIVYLTLGALLARAQRRGQARLFILASALALTLAIGLSRLYLGVHWPTDVLAGWIFGSGWAIAASLIVARLQGEKAVEAPG